MQLPPEKGSVTFEQEVRTTFERIRNSLGKLGASMNHVVSIKTYLTDLGPYAVFSRIRGEFFAKDPPTSTAVQVAGLLLNAGSRSICSSCPLDPPRESDYRRLSRPHRSTALMERSMRPSVAALASTVIASPIRWWMKPAPAP